MFQLGPGPRERIHEHTKKQGNERIDHFIAKVARESKQPKHDSDRNKSEHYFESFDDAQDPAKLLDVVLKLLC